MPCLIRRSRSCPSSISGSFGRFASTRTFVGCPALDVIRGSIAERLGELAPGAVIEVVVSYDEPWTTERISDAGRRALREHGFAPPGRLRVGPAATDIADQPRRANGRALPLAPIRLDEPIPCPYCGSRRTVLENLFGPTPCRSIHHCSDCRQPFERFKPV